MPQDNTIQDIIGRLEQARDRCQNAGDDQGVQDAEQSIADLQRLDPSALPTARDIEDYFNERMATRETGSKGPRGAVPGIHEPSPIRGAGIGRTAAGWDDNLSDDS
jgi:hypothetical protein